MFSWCKCKFIWMATVCVDCEAYWNCVNFNDTFRSCVDNNCDIWATFNYLGGNVQCKFILNLPYIWSFLSLWQVFSSIRFPAREKSGVLQVVQKSNFPSHFLSRNYPNHLSRRCHPDHLSGRCHPNHLSGLYYTNSSVRMLVRPSRLPIRYG